MDECTVCLCPVARTRQSQALPCGHLFHKSCISRWTQVGTETCPTCRLDIAKPEYKITIHIENLKNKQRINLENQEVNQELVSFLAQFIPNRESFTTTQLELSTHSLEEFHEIMSDFGILGSVDVNSPVFNTE
jgi:hypothetical protein